MVKKQAKVLKITLVKSPIGNTKRHKDTVKALGLKKIGQTVEKANNPAVLGMLDKIEHLIEVQE